MIIISITATDRQTPQLGKIAEPTEPNKKEAPRQFQDLREIQ
jgi:hypothetical protein